VESLALFVIKNKESAICSFVKEFCEDLVIILEIHQAEKVKTPQHEILLLREQT